MAAQGQRFGFKIVLIEFVSDFDISNEFSQESNTFRVVTGPLDFNSGAKNGLKSIYLVKKERARSMIWFQNSYDRN